VSPMPYLLSKDVGTPCSHVSSYFVGPFTKWGINFTTCHPVSVRRHRYIIVVVEYFTKWVKVMSTFNSDEETNVLSFLTRL
jgi:hypothetical protein